MFKYTSQKQQSIFDFHTAFESHLSAGNRWVKMEKVLDWDKLASIYSGSFSSTMGAGSKDARLVIGALIIKHIECKSDISTIEAIQENPYMQFFLGLDHFTSKPVFDPSLFVYIRKRLGNESFDKMNQAIMNQALGERVQEDNKPSKKDTDKPTKGKVQTQEKNKGKLQVDATVSDADIKFPTDLNLLNEAREKAEKLIDKLHKGLRLKEKPRTYRRKARSQYLDIAKKKKKGKKMIRKGVRQQLGYLKRDIGHIDKILKENEYGLFFFSKKDKAYLETIQKLYEQQNQMYQTDTRSIPQRIVSIHQPFIRPIVRGKEGRKVEFGAKINISLTKGYARINQFNFEAFNEGGCLQEQVASYRKQFGCYPELVQTDKIYMTRENRAYLKERNIRHTGKPMGRKPKSDKLTPYQKRKKSQEKNERNQIEGKFGEGKRRYKLNKILAKLPETQESWIASIVFVMNIRKLVADIFCPVFKLLFFGNFPTTKSRFSKFQRVMNC